jgi:hypothetical protein
MLPHLGYPLQTLVYIPEGTGFGLTTEEEVSETKLASKRLKVSEESPAPWRCSMVGIDVYVVLLCSVGT